MDFQNSLRNFSIIAHIDHGKSTLADRLLELTGTIPKRKMQAQVLDSMDLERERGITIKMQPVTMQYKISSKLKNFLNFSLYTLNLIDTPGHADFAYEVSRSLAAVEGALLLVDAAQGVEAQTISNLYFALEQNLEIIPIINKIDLKNANLEKTKTEIIGLLGCKESDIIAVSAKTGRNIEQIFEAIINKIPYPKGDREKPFRALIFDSFYDDFRGVICDVRLVDGQVKKGDKIKFFATQAESEVQEVGVWSPAAKPKLVLQAGEIGYIVSGLKDVAKCRVGDTIIKSKVSPRKFSGRESQKSKIIFANSEATISPLPGYKEPKPMVFATVFAKEAGHFEDLREAFLKLKLNDASLTFKPETSSLGRGFRAGFLGLLHLDITLERIKREYKIELVATSPSVGYQFKSNNNQVETEPWVKIDIITQEKYIGKIMEFVMSKRGEYLNMEYLTASKSQNVSSKTEDKITQSPFRNELQLQTNKSTSIADSALRLKKTDRQQSKSIFESHSRRVILHFNLPLSAMLVNFYDGLKSISQGYTSFSYEFWEYRPAEIAKLEILIAGEVKPAFTTFIHKDEAYYYGKNLLLRLKEKIPKHLFEIKLQASLGGRIIAAEKISPLRKDVTAKLYGGDVTRKMKLLEKQKKGKKRLKNFGAVEIPAEAYLAVLGT